MTSRVAKPVDGYDYTWEPLPGGAVFNPTGSTGLQVEATEYNLVAVDLRTPDQKLQELVVQVDMLRADFSALVRRLEQMFEIRL